MKACRLLGITSAVSAKNTEAAHSFLFYVKGDAVADLLKKYGFDVTRPPAK
jgi:ABC-type molybdate transport system substrate-binding protein